MRLFPVLVYVVLAAGAAYGWGERGHQTVNHAAVQTREFVRLGGLTVPLGLLASTVGLWLALHVV